MNSALLRGVASRLFLVLCVCLLLAAFAGSAHAAGVATQVYIGNSGNLDASVGLNPLKDYISAVNVNGGTLSINGVAFSAGNLGVSASTGNPSGTNWWIGGNTSVWAPGTPAAAFGGQLGALTNYFDYGAGASGGTIGLTGLTPGQTYTFTLYQRAWDGNGGRKANITTSDGTTFVNDVDYGDPASGNSLNLMRYTFVATSGTETLVDVPQTGNTMHMYGFSTEQNFFNTTSGSGSSINWSALPWTNTQSSGTTTTPSGSDANASFTLASAPTTITLTSPTTVGYLQFAGSNSYTLSGSTLTLQADVGGTALLNAFSGAHTISSAIVLNSPAAALGSGTLSLLGAVTGTGALSINNGVLGLAATNNNISGISLNKGGTLDLLGSNAISNSPLTLSGGTLMFDSSVGSNAFTLGSLSGTGNVALNNNAASPSAIVLTVGSNNLSATDAISFTGSGSLVKAGTGTLTLAASSGYSGGTSISAGIVAATNNYAFGSGTVTVAGGGEIYNTTAGTIANPLSLSGTGVSGMSVRQGGNTAGIYSGPVALAGNTTVSADSGSSLAFSNSLALTGNTLTLSGGSGSTVTISGNIAADAGAIVSNGSQVLLSGTNGYSGGTTVGAGMLIAATPAALPYYSSAGSVSVLSGATLRVNGGASGWGGTGTNIDPLWQNAKFALGSVLGIDTTGGGVMDGSIYGNFGLAVSGSNMLTLIGANTYLGPTTITGGTLNVTGSIPATGVTINGGTLISGGSLGGLTLTSGGLTLAGTAISTLTAGTANIAAGTQISNIIVGSSGLSSQIQTTSLTLATSGSPITINLTDNLNANGQGSPGAAGSIYPIISYTSLSGGNSTSFGSTFRVGSKPASLATSGIGFFNSPATDTVDMVVTALNPLLYQDTFNRSSSTLNGSSPTIQNGTNNTWTASPSWSTSASAGGLATTGTAAVSATNLLPFVPTNGNVYTLSGVLNCTTTNTNWLALGFMNSAATTGAFNTASTLAWVLERGNMTGSNSGNYDQAFGLGAGGNLPSNFQSAQASGQQNFTMVLDTRGNLNASTIYWLVNGQIASSATLNLTGTNTVADIAFGASGATGTVSNLSLASGSVWLGAAGISGTAASWSNGTVANSTTSAVAMAGWSAGAIPTSPGSTATFGSSTGTANQAITLDGSRSVGQLTFANSFLNPGNYTIAPGSGGTLTFDNSNNGAAVTSYAGSNTISAPVGFNDNVQAMISTGSTLNISGNISDTGSHSLAVNPTGTAGLLILSGTNAYGGGTSVYSGALQLGSVSAAGTGTITANGGGGQVYVNELSGTMANNFNLAGTSASGPNGNGALVFHNDSQNLTLSGSVTLSGATQIRAYASSSGTTTFSQPIGGTGPLTFESGGTASTNNQYWNLQGGASTYVGNTTIAGDNAANSIVRLQGGSLPSGTVLTMADGFSSSIPTNAVLDLNGNSQTLAGLQSTSNGGLGQFIVNSSSTYSILTVNNSASTVFGGVIGVNSAAATTGQAAGTGNINLVKTGTGTLTLGGANTYTGTTAINAGVLQLGTPAAVAQYHLDGTPGAIAAGTTILDSAGGGHNGTMGAAGASFIAGGRFNQAVNFTGAQSITIPYSSKFALNTYTVSAWLDVVAQPTGLDGIFGTRSGSDNTFDFKYQYAAGAGLIHGDIGNGGGWLTTTADAPATLALNTWNMITYSVNGSGYTIYLNGNSIGSGTYSGTPLLMNPGSTMTIGDCLNGSELMVGSIDETNVFGTALNATQVRNLYLNGIGSLPALTPLTISSGGTLDLNGASQQVGSLADGSGSGVVTNSFSGSSATLTLAPVAGSTTFSGTIQNGAGTVNLVLSGNTAAAQWLTNVNTFSGNTNVASGSLVLANSGALTNSTLTSGGIVFDQSVSSHAFTVGGLSGNFPLVLQDDANNPVALSVGNNNLSSTYAGILSGNGSLTKIGSGLLSLAASANSFSGGVTLNTGVLQGTGALPFGTGTLAINGGTLQMLNNMGGFYNNNVTVNSAGTISVATNGAANTGTNGSVYQFGTLSDPTGAVLTVTGSNNSKLVFTAADATLTGAGSPTTFNVASGVSLILPGGFNDSNRPTNSGTGILVFSGSNTFSTGLTISAGSTGGVAAQANAVSAPYGAGIAVTLNNNSTLEPHHPARRRLAQYAELRRLYRWRSHGTIQLLHRQHQRQQLPQ